MSSNLFFRHTTQAGQAWDPNDPKTVLNEVERNKKKRNNDRWGRNLVKLTKMVGGQISMKWVCEDSPKGKELPCEQRKDITKALSFNQKDSSEAKREGNGWTELLSALYRHTKQLNTKKSRLHEVKNCPLLHSPVLHPSLKPHEALQMASILNHLVKNTESPHYFPKDCPPQLA